MENTQTLENFGKLVDEYKLDILNYYPYGPKTEWSYWLCGTVDLRKEYKDPRNKGKTEEQYVMNILGEISRAMHYLIAVGNCIGFDRQRLQAFSMCSLLTRGVMDWTKEFNTLPKKEQDALFEYHNDRSDLVYSNGKYADTKTKLYEKQKLKKMKPEELQRYLKGEKEHVEYNRKENGIFEVKHFPLRNSKKILYTKQQLAAIELMVDCAFENLC